MANNIYLKLDGAKSGIIEGPGTSTKGNKQWIVTSYLHQATESTDLGSGLPTGRLLHKPVVVTIGWGPNVPLIWELLLTNEDLLSATITFVGDNEEGAERADYTITLVNAELVEIVEMASNNLPSLQLSFDYQKLDGVSYNGTEYVDDWERDS